MIFRRMRAKRFRDYPFAYKLIFTYIALTVLPLLLLVYITYTQYARSVEEQIGEYMPRFLYQANADIEKHLEELTTLPEMLFNSEDILSILRRGDAYERRSDYNRDQYALNGYLARTYTSGRNADVMGVFVLSDGRLFHSSKVGFADADWSGKLAAFISGNQTTGSQPRVALPDEIDVKFDTDAPYVFILKPINDNDNRKKLGTMLIAVDLGFIDDIVTNFEKNERAELWVMASNAKIVYHTNRARIGSTDEEKPRYPTLTGSFRTNGEGPAKLVSVNQSPKRGWILVHSIPLKELTKKTDLVRNVSVVAIIGAILLTSIIAIVISYSMTRPLKKLSGLMKAVEMGDMQVDLKVQSGDEVGALARSFNSMISTIRNLIQQNYRIELRQKEAELYALQSQINPHFMYNTLETIGMAVEEGETDQVVDMVTLLGRMLRFSVSNQSKSVTIAEEVQHVRDYLTIQKFRFEDRVRFDIVQVMDDEDARSLYTPKFILQPIVENAIKYGLETRKALEVHIAASQEFVARTGKRDIVFRIRDNGPGIPSEKMEALEQSLKKGGFEERDAHFGLINVNARIAMIHGADYGLQLHSIVGIGTEVIVRIPVTRGEVNANADD